MESTPENALRQWVAERLPHVADEQLSNAPSKDPQTSYVESHQVVRLCHLCPCRCDQCETNPIRDAQVLDKTLGDGETASYTLEEIENVISASVDRVDCQLIMALSFFMGLRKGEIGGLQWGDIDVDYIHVRRNLTKGKGGLHLTTPKTKKSVRSVPIIQPVLGLLLLWRSKNPDGVFVFASTLTNLAKVTINPTLEKAGVQWKGYHAGHRAVGWLGTTLRVLAGSSNAGRCMLGPSTDAVTKARCEAEMPEEVRKGMKLLEAKVKK